MTCEVSFGIVFQFLFQLTSNQEHCLFVFQWFWTTKKHWFSDHFFIDCSCFSKPLPGTISRGSQCRTFLKKLFLMPFSIFMVFKKAPFGHLFRAAGHQKPTTPNSELRPWCRPCFSRNHSNYRLVWTCFFLTSFFRRRLAN